MKKRLSGAVAWSEYLHGHARRIYASVTDMARVAAALVIPGGRRFAGTRKSEGFPVAGRGVPGAYP